MGWRKRERKMIDHIARLEERVKGERIARKLLAEEMSRRLSELNHEGERLKEMQAKSVTRELFDAVTRPLTARIATWAGAAAVIAALLGWFLRRPL